MAAVFLTGASGFMGQRLSAELVRRGHRVRGLVRRGSEKRLAPGCEGVTGDPLDASTYRDFVSGCDTFVQLGGVAHPNPSKAEQFRKIDLVSAKAAIGAACSGKKVSSGPRRCPSHRASPVMSSLFTRGMASRASA